MLFDIVVAVCQNYSAVTSVSTEFDFIKHLTEKLSKISVIQGNDNNKMYICQIL